MFSFFFHMGVYPLFLYLFLSISLAQAQSVLQVGQALTLEQTLSSPDRNNGFLFGFSENQHTEGTYSIGIWYKNSFERTLVWGITDDRREVLNFTKNAQVLLQNDSLVVHDSDRQALEMAKCRNSACFNLTMQDNGNLVLGNRDGVALWQSFNSPTDTLLPDQPLEGNKTLRSGRFILYMDLNLVGLRSLEFPENKNYWSKTNSKFNYYDSPKNSKPPKLVLNSTGIMVFMDATGNAWYNGQFDNSYVYALDYASSDVYARRLKLEPNGNLRIYSKTSSNGTWNIVWQALLEECSIHTACGEFGLCTYKPQATCTCPPGFHAKDFSTGCQYNVPIDCNASSYNYVRLDRADYPFNDYKYNPAITSLDGCKARCSADCNCLGVGYKLEGSGLCFQKGTTNGQRRLFNGVQGADQNNMFFLKVSTSDTTVPVSTGTLDKFFNTDVNATNNVQTAVYTLVKKRDGELSPAAVVSIAVGEFVVFSALVLGLLLYYRSRIRDIGKSMEVDGSLTRFTYHQLELSTNFFKHKLGSGGFGTVYKGVLNSGTVIAVKNIEAATQAESQFRAEVATLGNIHHINLVRLLGYCAEGTQRLLVYEFMPRGSLEKVLFSDVDVEDLDLDGDRNFHDWKRRFAVVLGIARGITYLHEECRECILHCDIKPQNILLDEDFCPKVADFGLAKLVQKEGDNLSITTVRGTRGYMAPEWISNMSITSKVDVYSFGMVLLEMMSGRDKFLFTTSALSTDKWYFPVWAFQRYVAGDVCSIADPKISDTVDWVQFEMVLRVSFWCIQPDPNSRPSMSKVVQMLEENIQVPEPPFPRLLHSEPACKCPNPEHGSQLCTSKFQIEHVN